MRCVLLSFEVWGVEARFRWDFLAALLLGERVYATRCGGIRPSLQHLRRGEPDRPDPHLSPSDSAALPLDLQRGRMSGRCVSRAPYRRAIQSRRARRFRGTTVPGRCTSLQPPPSAQRASQRRSACRPHTAHFNGQDFHPSVSQSDRLCEACVYVCVSRMMSRSAH